MERYCNLEANKKGPFSLMVCYFCSLCIVWVERNNRYVDKKEEEVDLLWDRIRFLASFRASLSKLFRDFFFGSTLETIFMCNS